MNGELIHVCDRSLQFGRLCLARGGVCRIEISFTNLLWLLLSLLLSLLCCWRSIGVLSDDAYSASDAFLSLRTHTQIKKQINKQ